MTANSVNTSNMQMNQAPTQGVVANPNMKNVPLEHKVANPPANMKRQPLKDVIEKTANKERIVIPQNGDSKKIQGQISAFLGIGAFVISIPLIVKPVAKLVKKIFK